MKVKIGDVVYDVKDQIIALLLSPLDRLNIIAMKPNSDTFMVGPGGTTLEEMEKFAISFDQAQE